MKTRKKKIGIYAGVLLTAVMFCIPAVCGETGKGDVTPPIIYKPTEITCRPIVENNVVIGTELTVTYYRNGYDHHQNLQGVFSAMTTDGTGVQASFTHEDQWGGSGTGYTWTRTFTGTWASYRMMLTEKVDNLPVKNLVFIYPAIPCIIGPITGPAY